MDRSSLSSVPFWKEWKNLRFSERSSILRELLRKPSQNFLPAMYTIALLADWGGDNPAAHHIAGVVRRQRPNSRDPPLAISITVASKAGMQKPSCSFGTLQTNARYPEIGISPGTSYALNGNHEMYSGGEAYFSVVLKALGQLQPFFCLENEYWEDYRA